MLEYLANAATFAMPLVGGKEAWPSQGEESRRVCVPRIREPKTSGLTGTLFPVCTYGVYQHAKSVRAHECRCLQVCLCVLMHDL